ncbi:AzlD domain-containing protein [Mycolicibacterium austroafricanum]|uniref:AzlD domain-containing protein n=1 Tax=Mycolicibacterium austroafricanum TaxID=39687 RepID=A0ABT8H8S5_MYCAO|nr:AzlD domain-containing protein [Mycolicibacterium austroafricanum]MDN4517165.1 AzlD domain-containing protein [Mycolicibacterium austroafricanum]
MSTATVWLIIAAVAIGGFVLRAVFILVPILPRNLPPRLNLVLQMVPAAAFAALVAPALFLEEGRLQLISPATLAGAIALLVSFRWKNLALSIVCGLVAYGCLDILL